MGDFRAAVAAVQSVALTLAVLTFCPCESRPAGGAEPSHSCCQQSGIVLRSADVDCCGHCAVREDSAAMPTPQTTPLDSPSSLVTAVVAALGDDVGAELRAAATALAPSPPAFSAPTPLRI